jgi:hypothetical protein
MDKIATKLTVFFDDPFWKGLFELKHKSKSVVCKITFGAEPKDSEIYNFLLNNWNKLRFNPSLDVDMRDRPNIY